MTASNRVVVNFSGGEVNPDLAARTDLPLYARAVTRLQNFIALAQGPTRFRSGTRYVHHTRRHNVGVFIEFQFSDIQSYLIEATQGYFRFYKDEGIILNTAQNITGITQASPGVLTYSGSDTYANGDEVYISGVSGMTEINGMYAIVTNVNTGANTFQLYDSFGNAIDTSGFTAYSSGGTIASIYEIKTPYLEADLPLLRFAQRADVMYLAARNYEPRKLTRTGHTAWSLARYARTADPFAAENVTVGTVTGITQANPGVVSDAGHTFSVNDHVYVSGVVGMTQLNDRHFRINTAAAGSYTLKDYDTGVAVDTSAYGAYSSGGVVERIGHSRYPGAVSFTDDSRLAFAGSTGNPETLWFSKTPTAAGAVQFDDFTTGTAATDGLIFTVAPLQGKVDSIRWVTNTDKYIAAGTFGTIRRLFGATEQASIAPEEVSAKAANSDGVYPAAPLVDGSVLFYIGRSGLSLETIEYDYQVDGYAPDDKNLVTGHLTTGGLTKISRQTGKPTIIWALRADGVLLGLTFKAKENVAGWSRHYLGGESAVLSMGIMPRESNQDQLWLIVERTINEQTVRQVEFMTDSPSFPEEADFFTGEGNEANDRERFLNYQSEVVKQAIHLDCSLTYDGSDLGVSAGASITLGEDADEPFGVGQTDITVTASAAVFTADMVGREIWGAYTSEGIGGGRILITDYDSATQIRGTIIDTFPSTATYPAGDWYLTATTVTGLGHLEGQPVGVVADGAMENDSVVEDGEVTLDQPASVIHVGLRYLGLIRTMPLDQGGTSGPAANKPKNVYKVAINFQNSSGVKFGASMYRLGEMQFRESQDFTDRPVPLYTGAEVVFYEDSTDFRKELYILQESALPCKILSFDIFTETSDE